MDLQQVDTQLGGGDGEGDNFNLGQMQMGVKLDSSYIDGDNHMDNSLMGMDVQGGDMAGLGFNGPPVDDGIVQMDAN